MNNEEKEPVQEEELDSIAGGLIVFPPYKNLGGGETRDDRFKKTITVDDIKN